MCGDHDGGVQFTSITRLTGDDSAHMVATDSRQRHDTPWLADVDSRPACLVDE
jgi:hypothetical protein